MSTFVASNSTHIVFPNIIYRKYRHMPILPGAKSA